MGANIGWLFYKEYFKDIDYSKLDSPKNEITINKKVAHIISQKPTIEEAEVLGTTHFSARTTYPGLLLGSGNSHELPDIKGQAILGFHFDYTSGLPIIQGSSIKGVLRSAFKHGEYIQELLKNETLDVKELEKEIFENSDIFFDATISNVEGKILGDDYIAPHANELKDPIPLRFIKVLPNITFRFDFELSDGLITKEQKSKLFQEILEDLGLGAKTNVGYGKFENFNVYKTAEEKEQEIKEAEEKKEQEAKHRELEQEALKEEKQQKAKNGINALSDCKTLADAFKLLKESFGAKPKTSPEQKALIQAFYNKQKNLSKSDIKVFDKYLK